MKLRFYLLKCPTSSSGVVMEETMIWTLATMLKFPCFNFFWNYVKHINDIHHTLFPYIDGQRIQKKILCTSSMDNHLKIGARNWKNYDLDTCNYASAHVLHLFKIMSNKLMIFVPHVFHSLNIKESQNKYIVHNFHGQPPQNRIT